MQWYHYVIIGVLILIIIPHFVASFFVFKFIFERNSKAEIPYKEIDLFKMPHKIQKDRIYEAIDFLESKSYEEVSITSFDGLKLKGKYFNNNSNTTILLSHGYRSMPFNAFNMAAKALYEKGYNLLFIHHRAHGCSEGKYSTFGIKERIDIRNWVDFLNSKYPVDNIILYGSSMGCASIEMSLELDMPSNIKGCILDCGFDNVFKLMISECRKRNPFNVKLTVLTMNLYCKLFAKFSMFETKSSSSIAKSNIPCFFITGKADEVVDFAHVQANYNACKAYKESVFLDGVLHGMCYYEDYPNLENKILNFIENVAK